MNARPVFLRAGCRDLHFNRPPRRIPVRHARPLVRPALLLAFVLALVAGTVSLPDVYQLVIYAGLLVVLLLIAALAGVVAWAYA
jgi:hypothetical protein